MALSPADKKSTLLEKGRPAPEAVEAHFHRLGADYWNAFSCDEIEQHIATLQELTATTPWRVTVEDLGDGLSGLTLIGGDFQGFFAAVSGFLASDGYDIRSGRVFSFAARSNLRSLPRGGVLDFLVLRHEDPERATPKERARVTAMMEDLFRRFGAGEGAAIRTELYRRIGARLEAHAAPVEDPVPMEIRVHAVHDGTRLTVRARDREGMLFCIASALGLQGISLVTLISDSKPDGFFENTLTVAGPGGVPVRDARELEKMRTGIALMERLLRTLPGAVNLQAAAEGLQRLVDDWLEETSAVFAPPSKMEAETAAEGRGNLGVLPALSRVLTAGPRLWDAVDRLGPRAFRVLLSELAREIVPPTRESFTQAFRSSIADITESAIETLQHFRAREILKAELDFLLTPSRDWRAFSERLSALAEACLAVSVDRILSDLTARHGDPGTWALFALGKFGGEELGSGSDLEVLLVYEGGRDTTGGEPLRPGEFFERLFRDLIRDWAIPEGETFALDTRLRPHGESGPLAVRRAKWDEYYKRDGAALDYERQALIRLRTVHGDAAWAEDLLAARDAIVYAEPPLAIAETLELFARQAAAKEKKDATTGAPLWNAKFGRGGLAELEYGVQFLQLRFGAAKPELRKHQWVRALEALLETGVVALAEFEHLYAANLFLRRLVNALRLARGQSKDLYCPAPHTAEFSFLARRLGYVSRPDATPEQALERDLQRARNTVATFFRYRFQNGPRPDWLYESLAETLMDPEATMEEAAPALARLGMTDVPVARRLFFELFDTLLEKRLAAACLLSVEGIFRRSPDPEGVLRHLVRYLRALEHPDVFIRQALHHPPLLEKLLLIFANSDPLSDLAVREGEGFKDLIEPESLDKPRLPDEYLSLARAAAQDATLGADLGARLCRLRNREYLRIALRDLHLSVPLREITFEISGLSDALMSVAFDHVLEESGTDGGACLAGNFSVLALGKLGGAELNYSSDVDLVFVLDDSAACGENTGGREAAERAGRAFISLLSSDTTEGRIFRVDMKLRPWGGQGPLVGTVSQYTSYFRTEADGWELQAWLKARVACGAVLPGRTVIDAAQAHACAPENAEKVVASMRKVRLQGLDVLHRGDNLAGEVKLGPGGIRTVEFFTQALQLRHAARIPELLTGNTLEALGRLNRYGILPGARYQLLSEAYVFLRRVEHRLQLQGLQQRHAMPTAPRELDRLARQMGFEDRVGRPARDAFLEQYRKFVLSLQPISAELFDH
jgi:glutamate-ammonia-ligase adenylyltransferase